MEENFSLEIGSSLMYCSSCITGNTDPYDMISAFGKKSFYIKKTYKKVSNISHNFRSAF